MSVEPHGVARGRGSLQSRLLASHALVILIALSLVLLISAVFLRRYEHDASRRQLTQLAVPLVAEANVARFGSLAAELRLSRRVEAIDAQAAALNMRILVLDSAGVVIYDTDQTSNVRGETLGNLSSTAVRLIAAAQTSEQIRTSYSEPRGQSRFAGERVVVAAGSTGPLQARNAIVMVAEKSRRPLLAMFVPRLVLIAGVSLVIASIAALAFSRRLARPVQRLIAATDAMSRGDLHQQVESDGPDELDRLVQSFNSMSAQVAAINRSQRELLANVAHELRTPLTSVQGYAKAIQDGVTRTDAERNAALTVIARESERMGRLITDLLELSRLESGQTKMKLRPVAVARLFDRLNERFLPAIDASGLRLTRDAPSDLIVAADEARLLQALSNLMANAIRHTPAGGAIALAARRHDGKVQIAVRDSGEGIAPERLGSIFDRFERGETVDGDATGFGLGLAITRELIELHGGSIAVESAPGAGSIFTIELPTANPEP